MTDQEQARIAANMVNEKLERIVNHIRQELIQQNSPAGNNTPSYTYACRIIKSRQRLVERLFIMRYGTEQQKAIARIELSLKTQDTGKLIKDENGKQHTQGRIDCRACDSTDDSSAFPVPMTCLCEKCKLGLKHFYTTVKEVPPLSTSIVDISTRSGSSKQDLQLNNTPINRQALYYQRISICENCNVSTSVEDWRVEPSDTIDIPIEIKINL